MSLIDGGQSSIQSLDLEGPPLWQGAEAKIYKSEFEGKQAICKQRFIKKYRHPQLDSKLNSRRIRQEARCLERAGKNGISVPQVYQVNETEFRLVMEFVNGPTVKDALLTDPQLYSQVGPVIGRLVANLHNHGIIHGDLTTSNFILRSGQPDKCVVIDFGLASISNSDEDRAVDLYVLERAIRSTHAQIGEDFFRIIIDAYTENFKSSKSTMIRLAEVQRRGRKRDMTG